VSEVCSKKDLKTEDYKTQDSKMNKDIISVSFDDTEKSVPMSSEKSAHKYNDVSNDDIHKYNTYEDAIHALSINQVKLKRIFNYHIKTTHNKIEFAEFLKFCKSTQIFPNFISIIYLKKVIEQILFDDCKLGGKKSSGQDAPVSNSTMITFKEFHKSIKKMALYTLENSSQVAAGEKIRAFIKHVNVNCQYNYNVNSLITEHPNSPVKGNIHKSFSSICEDFTDDQIQKSMNFINDVPEMEDIEVGRYSVPNPNRIDENIDKALKALKSPRLSLPNSTDKSSKVESSKA
jgi:hypothetical protein